LPVEVDDGGSLPDGSSAVSATASQNGGRLAVTLINRHWDRPASIRLTGAANRQGEPQGELLSADTPRATNSLSQPDRVAPVALAVQRDGDTYRIELPPHSLATVVL
jgi:alpha-L-arabinofuranosidase